MHARNSLSPRSLFGCGLVLLSAACAESGSPGTTAGAGSQGLTIAGGAVQFYAGETREFSVLGVTEPVEWEVSAGAGTLVADGSTAVLYAGTAGLHTISARLVSDPSMEGEVSFRIFSLEYRGDHEAIVVPECSTSRFRGRDVAVTDDALYVAATLCGQYSRFSKHPLGGGDILFHEVTQTSWPPTAQEQAKRLAVDSTGRVYLYVDVPLTGIDCSQPASQGDYRGEVRRYVEIEGGGFEEDVVWDADAYHPTLEVGADDTLFMLRRVGAGDADQLVNLSGEGQVLGSFGFEIAGAGHMVVDVSGLALGSAGEPDVVYIASGDFNVAVDPGVERWLFDDVDQVYVRAEAWRDPAYVAAWGVDVDDSGRVFLALQETFGNNLARVRIFNGVLDPIDSYPPAASIQQIQRPTAMTVDGTGDVWFFDELEPSSSPAARIGIADFEPGPTTPEFRILPRGVVQRAGYSQIFNVQGAPPNTVQVTWQTNQGPHRTLTPLGEIIRFIAGGTVGSGPLTATALDGDGNVLAETQVAITLTQFMTHGFSVPFGTPGQDGSSADYDIATGGGYVWVALNDGLNLPAIERYPVGDFTRTGMEAYFCANGSAPSCDFDPWFPRANIAADGQRAYWLGRDSTVGLDVLYWASHSAATGDKQSFTLPDEVNVTGAIAVGGPGFAGAIASVYLVATNSGAASLVRVDFGGGGVIGIDDHVVDFGPGDGPDHLAIHVVTDASGNQETRVVAVDASGFVVEYNAAGMPLAAFSTPSGVRAAEVGADGVLYVATHAGTGTSERSTLRVFSLEAGDEAMEIASVSDYQYAEETGGLEAPRLVRVEAIAVDDEGCIFLADDIDWCDLLPPPCDGDSCGFGTLAAFVTIRPDGSIVASPDVSCP